MSAPAGIIVWCGTCLAYSFVVFSCDCIIRLSALLRLPLYGFALNLNVVLER